jgi:TonB family protein
VVDYIFSMAAGPQSRGWDRPSRRHGVRYRVEAPLDVTVLRSGIPDTVPGRSLNLGAGGVAAVLAGELLPGEAVGVEIRLPESANPLRTRALVRHHDKLRCGMEFVALSPEQQLAIRNWTEKTSPKPEPDVRSQPPAEASKSAESGGRGGAPPPPPSQPPSPLPSQPPSQPKQRSRGWIFLVLSAAILLAVLWWRWDRSWEDLESGLPKTETAIPVQAHVPADVMEKLVRHRVDPDYPAAARPAKLQGVIVLDVVVGRDGSVVDVHALNGPDILAQAATDALRWWRFDPYRVDGQAVVAETTVAVEFKP